MKGFALLLIVFVAVCVSSVPAQTGPTIPTWIHPGLTVTYDGVSAFVQNGRFTQGIQVVMTTRVNSVGGNVVAASTQLQTVGSPVGGTHAWTCNAAGSCRSDLPGFSGQFWVDPNAPTASTHGPNGEPFSIVGKGPYSYGGKSWSATTIAYQNPATGWQISTIFETSSGLVLAHSENSPAQQVHVYFRAMR